MTKEESKQKIQKLIDRYNDLTPQEKKMNEEMTKAKFIRPLFEALGWDFEEDVLLEDKISRGRVDYNFQIDGKTKFFIEAKPLKADLDDLEYAKQATNYAWLKNVNWAVLTDFEGIRIFYPAEKGQAKSCFRLKYDSYLESFEDLWILSKESFEKNVIDEQAMKWGAKPEQIKVGEQLAEDMNNWRKSLYEHFKTWNTQVVEEDLDEGVQKILDRFIFIRSCEDRNLENDFLRSKYRIWQDDGRKGNFLASLKPFFAEYKKNYNSGLFDDHPVIDWEISSDCFDEIINGLYQSKNGQEYDFSIIDADVLGGVYEQYLGHLLSKSDDGDASKKKRKAQGIYYTPTFIVDYIVQNTLGKVLQEKSPQEIVNLKILDPACGSGSFLIKAFDYLVDYEIQQQNPKVNLKTKLGKLQQAFQKRDGLKEPSTSDKLNILRNNIYGVDLDQQAVEIAQLNLMLKTLDRKQPLPHLNNIKCGNSLIDDPKIAGDRVFNWNEQFSEVMKNGGFDIIIGNPPWGASLSFQDKEFYKKRYKSAKGIIDTFALFIEQSTNILKDEGSLGFILPDILLLKAYPEIRKLILDKFEITEIFYSGMIFKNVNLDSVCCVLKKKKSTESHKIKIYRSVVDHFNNISHEIPQSIFDQNDQYKFNLFFDDFNLRFKESLLKKSIPLKDFFETHEGIHTGNIRSKLFLKEKINNDCHKLIFKGDEIYRYGIHWAGNFVNYQKSLINRTEGEYASFSDAKFFNNPKILIRRTGDSVIATFDEDGYYASNNLFTLTPKTDKNYDLRFVTAILNSKLMSWYFNLIQPRKGKLFAELKINHINIFPLIKIDFSISLEKTKHDDLVKLSYEMLNLNKDLQAEENGTNRWNQLKSEIDRTDKIIDQKVYELYGLNKKEIDIIES